MKRVKQLTAISLFASGGIGDLALRENGVDVIVANELLEDRASLFRRNFPEAEMYSGDIWKLESTLINAVKKKLNDEELDFMLATPPCQGMSKNGQGKLLNEFRAGRRPKIDPRNRLIIPTLNIAVELKPKVIVFENVPEMRNTVIDDEDGNLVNIIDYIKHRLGDEYEGKAEVVQFADYGVPQRRQRLITVFTRVESAKKHFLASGSFLPKTTHNQTGSLGKKKWVTVRDIISDLPALSSEDKASSVSNIPYHDVPVLDTKKYTWISNTPPEKGAFDNQCINPKCLFDGNTAHSSARTEHGINRASEDTPLYCLKCNSLLPRPHTATKDGLRIMKGFTSAYKRMRWDMPSSTLTTNLQYPSSDHKIHPDQHRVLSLYEAFKLHTLDNYEFVWELETGKEASKGLVRDVMGESIPPKGLSILIESVLQSAYSAETISDIEPSEQEQVSLLSGQLSYSGLEN